jgi:hypothetical protein
MNKDLYIIADVSGSMNEMGKVYIQTGLLRYAASLRVLDPKYVDISIRFFQWSDSISEIVVEDGGVVPLLTSKGRSDLTSLSTFLSEALNSSRFLRVLLLSDGFFSSLDCAGFLKEMNLFSNLMLRTVAVGADADHVRLKSISSNKEVFLAEDISTAIDSIIWTSEHGVSYPESIHQIRRTPPVKSEEDWDV